MKRPVRVNNGAVSATQARLRSRCGATAVESALLLPICLVGLISLLDLMLVVLQHNSLSECARRAARVAIVRGDNSTVLTPLGPAPWAGTADQAAPMNDSIRSLLVCMPPAQVNIAATWPDGSNRSGQRINVVLTYEHRSLVSYLFGQSPWRLKASSTMRIVH